MRYLHVMFTLFLLLGLSAQALEPADLHDRLDKFRTVDRQIDNEVTLIRSKVDADHIPLQQAHALWAEQLARAQQNGDDVRALQDLAGDMTEELTGMCDLVRQQQGRVQLLVDASKLELEQGPQAAKEMYTYQAESLETYLQVRQQVDRLFGGGGAPSIDR